jgi:hypothetical protein
LEGGQGLLDAREDGVDLGDGLRVALAIDLEEADFFRQRLLVEWGVGWGHFFFRSRRVLQSVGRHLTSRWPQDEL